jgi:hypothetical protein
MAIGRTDERQNPLIPMAVTCRPVVWMSLADPIWASGQGLASKAGHMNAFEPRLISCKPLEPDGPSTHGIISTDGTLDSSRRRHGPTGHRSRYRVDTDGPIRSGHDAVRATECVSGFDGWYYLGRSRLDKQSKNFSPQRHGDRWQKYSRPPLQLCASVVKNSCFRSREIQISS